MKKTLYSKFVIWKIVLILQLMNIAIIGANADWMRRSFSSSNDLDNVNEVLNDNTHTYVAGKNYMLVVNRSCSNERCAKKIEFPHNEALLSVCEDQFGDVKAKQCLNVINVIQQYNASHLFVCGTHIQEPKCYFYNIQTSATAYTDEKFHSLISEDPNSRTASAINYDNPSDPSLYVASCKNSGTECTLYRTSVVSSTLHARNIPRRIFQSPGFVNTYVSNDKAYLFFRDESDLYQGGGFINSLDTNIPTLPYSFVARVCQSDEGGTSTLNRNFMTIMRARLLCPTSPDSQIYLDFLKRTYQVGKTIYGLYNVSSTSTLPTSAVCAYDVHQIDERIDGRIFPGENTLYYTKNFESQDYFGRPFCENSCDPPLPGQCFTPPQTTQNVEDRFAQFIVHAPVIGSNILPVGNSPSFLSSAFDFEFMAVAEIGAYHVLYLVGTNGNLTRVRVSSSGSNGVELAGTMLPINNERIQSISLTNDSLVVVTTTNVHAINLAVCSRYANCESCEADPCCDWIGNENSFKCIETSDGNNTVSVCPTPPSPPRNLSWDSSTDTFTWEPSSNSNNYLCTVIQRNNGVVAFESRTSRTSIQIGNSIFQLRDGTKYTFSVRAVNEISLSQALFQDFETGLAMPEDVTPDPRDTSATINWISSEFADVYNLSFYNTFPQRSLHCQFIAMNIGPGFEQSFVVGRLNPGRRYEGVIFASSSDSVNSQEQNFTFTTKEIEIETTSVQPTTVTRQSRKTENLPTAEKSDDSGGYAAILFFMILFVILFSVACGIIVTIHCFIGFHTHQIQIVETKEEELATALNFEKPAVAGKGTTTLQRRWFLFFVSSRTNARPIDDKERL